MTKVLLGIVLQVLISAQAATHSITWSWKDTTNPSTSFYNFYQLSGPCNGTTTGFSKLGTNLTIKSFVQTPVIPGVYCSYVTAINPDGTGESPASVTSQATVTGITILVAPNGLSAVIN